MILKPEILKYPLSQPTPFTPTVRITLTRVTYSVLYFKRDKTKYFVIAKIQCLMVK